MARIAVSIFLSLEQSLLASIPWPRISIVHHGRQSKWSPAVYLDGCVYLHHECGDCPAYLGDPFDPQESPAA